MPARVVDAAAEFPGVCALTGSSEGPFLQTDALTRPDNGGGTQYVKVARLIELARTVGCWDPHQVGAAQEALQRIPALEAALVALQAEHDRLVAAVGYTLKNGAVARKGEVVLRPIPGTPRVEV